MDTMGEDEMWHTKSHTGEVMITDRTAKEQAEYLGLENVQNFKHWIEKHPKVGNIGSGSTDLTSKLNLRDTTIYNVDLNNYPHLSNFWQGDASKLPYEDKFLDAAFSCMGLFFYARDVHSLYDQAKELRRVLKPNGSLIINSQVGIDIIPNLSKPSEELSKIDNFTVHTIDKQGVFEANVPQILKDCGFKESKRVVVKENNSILAIHLN